ncbi:TetR/AcrR family transcriptional regulator [Nonomuraea sp. LP-02]|uniref:TetR/AcrR family transcriptional regulator n=1 Tax=Nonomuraea sp. LP-02 TaxID=3097960 RepID=UPI002E31BC9B|nr:TetR/AcrR family transcriptional regulator [Nonomuraea sp. LP-02]MED7925032.1 TetR/AcrR family transcriptional regulator [Nonomuraea sp. LP-02]
MRSENEPTGQKVRSFIEDARRAQIVAAAIDVIADVGFAQASLARIARHAGISKGLISYHFAGKDELMTEVVVVTYTAIADHVLAEMKGIESPTELLRTHVLSVAAYMRGQRKGLKALGEIFGNLRDADGSPRFGIRTNEEIYRSLESIYRAGQATGEFRDFDVRVMAVTHSAAVDAMFAYWVAHPEHDLDEHARQLADLLERACVT